MSPAFWFSLKYAGLFDGGWAVVWGFNLHLLLNSEKLLTGTSHMLHLRLPTVTRRKHHIMKLRRKEWRIINKTLNMFHFSHPTSLPSGTDTSLIESLVFFHTFPYFVIPLLYSAQNLSKGIQVTRNH